MTLIAAFVAAVFALLIPVLALAALLSRSVLSIAIVVAAAGVLLAIVALTFGGSDVALAAAVAFGGWAPIILVALMLLTAQTARQSRRNLAWLAALPAAALAVALPFGQLGLARQSAIAAPEGAVFWLCLILMATGAVCVGLLAYGERGGFLGANPR